MQYSTLFTNDKRQKKKFLKEFEEVMKDSDSLHIASGYIGTSTIEDLETRLVKIAMRGSCKLLIGMVYHGGVTKKQYSALNTLDKKLRSISSENGVYISRVQYHGKIYRFLKDSIDYKIYLGSSNFSKEGLDSRLEATTLLIDDVSKTEVSSFLDYLFSLDTTARLEEVDLRITGSKKVKLLPSKDLEDYEIKESEYPDITKAVGICYIELRVDSQPRSSLNLYFDKGRKNQKGKYAPRPWYEVEITATSKEIKSPFYPESKSKGVKTKAREGSFIGYFKENGKFYKINMVVHADNGKNISSDKSSGGRATLGKIIKGRLERARLLKEGELITSDVLDAYGSNTLKLAKIDSNTYIIDF